MQVLQLDRAVKERALKERFKRRRRQQLALGRVWEDQLQVPAFRESVVV